MIKIDNTKLAAFSDQDLNKLIQNQANLAKLEKPLAQWQDRLRSGAEEFTQTSTRNWLNNLGFIDKFKLFLSKLFGVKSDIFEKFKSDQSRATKDYIKQNLNQLKYTFENKYGKGSFKQGLLTGDPRFIEHTSQWTPSNLTQNKDIQQPNSFSAWVGDKMYQYAKPQISSEFNKSWQAESMTPQKNHKQYWSDRIQNLYTKPNGGFLNNLKRKIITNRISSVPNENWENLSKLEQFSDMFDNNNLES